MNRGLSLFKVGMIALLIVGLMIPLMMINGLIEDRQGRRDAVVEDIARSSSYSQQLTGPLLIVPFRKTVRRVKENPTTKIQYTEETEDCGRL